MKKVLIFAKESNLATQIIQHLVAQHYEITVLTYEPFYNKELYINASPLQLNIILINLFNYYNWKLEIPKYDIIINTLTYEDFPKLNRDSVFLNFIVCLAETTQEFGKKTICLTESTHISSTGATECYKKMAVINPSIFHIKYFFLINGNSEFLHSVLNRKILIISSKLLKTRIKITTILDIQDAIISILKNQYSHTKFYISGEEFSIQDILTIAKTHTKIPYIIQIPHTIFTLITYIASFFLSKNNETILSDEVSTKIVNKHETPRWQKYHQHTLLSQIIQKHSKRFFHPEIE